VMDLEIAITVAALNPLVFGEKAGELLFAGAGRNKIHNVILTFDYFR